jgi:hypothetical protein
MEKVSMKKKKWKKQIYVENDIYRGNLDNIASKLDNSGEIQVAVLRNL